MHAAKDTSALFDTWAFMLKYEGLLRMQWEVAWRDGWEGGGVGGEGHGMHLVRAGAGDKPAPIAV